ncbi:MAG: hypothetical protein WBQ50_17930, partial [Nocardioides sp.]
MGVLVLLGACTGAGLLVTSDPTQTGTAGDDRVEAGGAQTGGNGYPGAVALEIARASRSAQASRGQGRTGPLAPVSSPAGPLAPSSSASPTRPVRSAPVPVGTESPDAGGTVESP